MIGIAMAAIMQPLAVGLSNYPNFTSKCLEFNPLNYVTNSAIITLEPVAKGSTIFYPNDDVTCNRPNQTVSVDICRIALNISTSSRSHVLAELWLPEAWDGRFLATGNGGLDGCTKYEDINYGAKYGFASIGSNNGHSGTSGVSFLHNNDVLEDYAYRSLHAITKMGKSLTSAFYSKTILKSYYLGCSGGGRQGLKAAEKYPRDFDGIVIGAPALNFNYLSSWRMSFLNKTGSIGSLDFIRPQVWKGLIHDEVLRQCDGIDGIEDGILEDPRKCHFDPEPLLCNGTGTNCLSPGQVQIVKSIFEPLIDMTGITVYQAMQPGSEILAADRLYAGLPFPYSLEWFRYVVHQDPAWDPQNFSDVDIILAQDLNPFNIMTYPRDLDSFRQKSGKMLIYHGLQDNQITSYTTDAFLRHLTTNAPISVLDNYIRYFRISGMAHCNSGPGAWMIGQSSLGDVGWGREENVLAAMVDWVERDEAPETIQGVKFIDDVKGNMVLRRRRHCRWPYENSYIGIEGGNGRSWDDWKCVLQSV
ncbi:alpha/beta-Hydrolase [Glarea lozoyensis ATCC 20868]|uniref:Carboxylic ester hydrolase n=1 Tax=Glarea lozoyensis (strain ATCC 20868 / MF5171) TaxID=1116229 RepID=S3CWV5_GLAL2|nr:alpha/beta-Hydrolase [Glarea lozoyensis ATCC 20868]EPE29434.1 alpha/beta-Hydrolase [Glarea lozoyensis ATCC 20868]